MQIKVNHANLSDQLLRIMRALDALEGQFAHAANYHNPRTYQVHEALSQDLKQLENYLAPNSARKLVTDGRAHSVLIMSCFVFFVLVIGAADASCLHVHTLCTNLKQTSLRHWVICSLQSCKLHVSLRYSSESSTLVVDCRGTAESSRSAVCSCTDAGNCFHAGQVNDTDST